MTTPLKIYNKLRCIYSRGYNMKLKLSYLVLLIFISIIIGCKKTSNSVYNNLSLPALNDSIPYESLGQGK
jgi:hypothetical protein